MSEKTRFPQYHIKMRGTKAVRITYEGQDLGTFDESDLWRAYSETRSPNDPNKRYVIERAIEALKGKDTGRYIRVREGSMQKVERWGLIYDNRLQQTKKRKKRSIVSRVWDWIFGV